MEIRNEAATTVALHLAKIWGVFRQGEFRRYLASVFNMTIDVAPEFECLYIAESLNGNLETGSMSSMIGRWWRVDDAGLVGVPRATMPNPNEVPYYKWPICTFFTDGQRAVMKESFGQGLLCQKTADIVLYGERIVVENVKLKWASSPPEYLRSKGNEGEARKFP